MSDNSRRHRQRSADSAEALLSEKNGRRPRSYSSSLLALPYTERRKFLFATCASFSALSLIALMVYSFWASQPLSRSVPEISLSEICADYMEQNPLDIPILEEEVLEIDPWENNPLHPKHHLNGPPTQSFRDNLRNDTRYITSWPAAGWTNDVMTFANLIYLGIITNRVPIMPKFTPSHVGGDVAPIAFSEVFDLQRLIQGIGKPVVEWHHVKDVHSEFVDDLGCWNVWESVQYVEQFPRKSAIPDWIKTDISYTKTPSWIKLVPDYEHDKHATFWALATLSYPQTRAESLTTPLPSPQHGLQLPPDEHLFCFDYGYYLCAHQPWEWELDYSPAYRNVAHHMRWSSSLWDIANSHIRRALGVPMGEPTPAWIAIHVRHHDFAVYCNDYSINECFAPLSAYERRVNEVRQELKERKGIDVQHVLMTSDEKDPSWWADVAALGWKHIDFEAERTEQIYGRWYPVLIDAVIQSMGQGFVGTDTSTMSIIATRRVQSWHEGAVRNVKWGKPGADDH